MASAACRMPKARKAPKCSLMRMALKPTTGMLAAQCVAAQAAGQPECILQRACLWPLPCLATETGNLEGCGSAGCAAGVAQHPVPAEHHDEFDCLPTEQPQPQAHVCHFMGPGCHPCLGEGAADSP